MISHEESSPGYVVPCITMAGWGRELLTAGKSSAKQWTIEPQATAGAPIEFKGLCIRGEVLAVAFVSGGVVTSSAQGKLQLWRYEATIRTHAEATAAHTFDGHTAEVFGIATVGAVLLSGSRDKTARAWEVETGRCLGRFDGHSSMVRAVAGSASAAFTGGDDRALRRFSRTAWSSRGTEADAKVANAHADWISALEFVDERLVSASLDGALKVWSVDLEPLLTITLPGACKGLSFDTVTYGEPIIYAGSEQKVFLYGMDGRLRKTVRLPQPVASVAVF
jgi:WD40 repeat protein